jgi:hypothetical protein
MNIENNQNKIMNTAAAMSKTGTITGGAENNNTNTINNNNLEI